MMLAQNDTTKQSEQDILSNNLRYLMYKARLNEAELARQTNIPQPTLHKILAGSTTDPRISTLRLLANHFDISIDQLYQLNNSFILQQKTQTQAIPIITWKDCLKSKSHIKTLTPENHNQWLITEPMGENAFALLSKPSMEPQFPRNTTFIIQTNITTSDGDLIVVHYPNTDEATLRELVIDGPSKLLLPLSTNSKPDLLDDSIKILGVLVQSRFAHHQ